MTLLNDPFLCEIANDGCARVAVEAQLFCYRADVTTRADISLGYCIERVNKLVLLASHFVEVS